MVKEVFFHISKKMNYLGVKNEEMNLKNNIKNLEFKNSLLSDKLDLDYVETFGEKSFYLVFKGETLYIIKKYDN